MGQAIVVAGGIGFDQNALDSVEILRMDRNDDLTKVMKENRHYCIFCFHYNCILQLIVIKGGITYCIFRSNGGSYQK